jgi:transposase
VGRRDRRRVDDVQANASMRSMLRKDFGKSWKDHTRKLLKNAGFEHPTDNELRQVDRSRLSQEVSNEDWDSPHAPNATITRIRNGTTRVGYKAERTVDLDTDIVVAVNVQSGNAPDTANIIGTAINAAVNAEKSGAEKNVQAIMPTRANTGQRS